MKKKILVMILCLSLLVPFAGCDGAYEYFDIEYRAEYSRTLEGTVLNVYNWGEYISDGYDGSIDVNKEFEKLTGIKVNYTTFESNETMYSQIVSGGVSYDIIIPSDYMIERLRKEGYLNKIDMSKITNYDLIDEKYKGVYYDETEEYSVPYNVGMVGVIYNSAMIPEIEHSWTALWNSKYKDNGILNFNNPRDAFMTAQMILGQDLNTTDKNDWKAAAELLKKEKKQLQSYVMDEIYGKMETGEAAVAPYYAGDYLTMKDVNDDLEFFYPEEGTNIFIDAVCIPSSAQHYEAALMYINFLLEPEIACANAEYIGYASPNTSVIENEDYCYFGEEILYPEEADMPKCQYYHDMDDNTRIFYEDLWIDVKLY